LARLRGIGERRILLHHALKNGVLPTLPLVGVQFGFLFGGIPFLTSLIAVGIGYGAGELISRSVNGKRGNGLAWIAGCSVAGAFAVSWLVFPSFGPLILLFVGFSVYTAVKRVR